MPHFEIKKKAIESICSRLWILAEKALEIIGFRMQILAKTLTFIHGHVIIYKATLMIFHTVIHNYKS